MAEDVSAVVASDVVGCFGKFVSSLERAAGGYRSDDKVLVATRKRGVLLWLRKHRGRWVADGPEALALSCVGKLVASGKFSGPEFAAIVRAAQRRAYVLGRAIGMLAGGHSVGGATYITSVNKLDCKAGVAVGDLEVYSDWFMAAVLDVIGVFATTTSVELVPGQSLFCEKFARVVGASDLSHVTVVPAEKSVSVGEPSSVVTVARTVYAALLGKVSVDAHQSYVWVSTGPDKINTLFEGSNGRYYDINSLPVGKYWLPGGYGRFVSHAYMMGLLQRVIVLPALSSTPGYCYLKLLPSGSQLSASKILGPYPVLSRLVSAFPQVYTWSTAVASWTYHGDVVHVHNVGALDPGVPLNYVVGGFEPAPRRNDHMRAAVHKVLAEMDRSAAVKSNPVLAAPFAADNRARTLSSATMSSRSPSSSGRGFEFLDREMSPGKFAPPDKVNTVHGNIARQVWQSGDGVAVRPLPVEWGPQDWERVDDPAVKEWSNRLAMGAPVSPTVLSLLRDGSFSSDEPLPVTYGDSLVLPQCDSFQHEQLSFKEKPCVLPNWRMASARLRADRSYSVVAPQPGVMFRLDWSSDGVLCVNDSLILPGTRASAWCTGAVVLQFKGYKGKVIRTYHLSGMDALGPQVRTLMNQYRIPAVRTYSGYGRGRIIPLRVAAQSPGSGMVRYDGTVDLSPGENQLVLYVGDEMGREASVLTVQARGMTQLSVGMIRLVNVVAGRASVIIERMQQDVVVFVTGSSRASFSFERFTPESQQVVSAAALLESGLGSRRLLTEHG